MKLLVMAEDVFQGVLGNYERMAEKYSGFLQAPVALHHLHESMTEVDDATLEEIAGDWARQHEAIGGAEAMPFMDCLLAHIEGK